MITFEKQLGLRKCFLTFLYFNGLFFAFQVIFLIITSYSFMQKLTLPLKVYWEIGLAFALQISLYLLLSMFQTVLLWGLVKTSKQQHLTHITQLQSVIFLLSVIEILCLNAYFFPLSVFSSLFLPGIPPYLILGFIYIASVLLLLLTLNAIWHLLSKYPIKSSIVCAFMLVITWPYSSKNHVILHNKQPNLIIIGVDSFSPEQVSPNLTPNIYHFLQNSVLFTNTISPLARTYAAWTSIFTGLYPIHHGARENLYPEFTVKYQDSIIWNFKKRGYQTLFATDDRRFNNISVNFGFDNIIGPKTGANDVLLGSSFDFPLSNFIINTSIARILLPYNHMNRAGHFSYYPQTFNQHLQNVLQHELSDKPLVLIVHFALPHWPYAWASSSRELVQDEFDMSGKEFLYHQSIHEADEQIGLLLNTLKHINALSNSTVVLLSDHGEAMYKHGSRKTSLNKHQGKKPSIFAEYIKNKTMTELDMSIGHGSDLLSPSQFQCLLGFQMFQNGVKITSPHVFHVAVALIDIAPTLASLFNIHLKQRPDGVSLATSILNGQQPPKDRSIFLESGMLPNQWFNRKKVAEYAKLFFQIKPNTTAIEVKPSEFATIRAEKIYGLESKQWLLTLYPADNRYLPVLLNLKTGLWSDDPSSTFVKSSPFNTMYQAIIAFYQLNDDPSKSLNNFSNSGL